MLLGEAVKAVSRRADVLAAPPLFEVVDLILVTAVTGAWLTIADAEKQKKQHRN